MKTVHLIIVRHGETIWNTQKRHQGQLDSPLTRTGQAQGLALAERLASFEILSLYSSDSPRTMETARLIQQRVDRPIQPDPRLRERHFGLFQGLTLAEAEQRHPEEYARHQSRDPDYIIPGGSFRL